MSLRLVFMGTPDFAVPTLVEIVGRGHDVAAVYTRAPKPAGRAAWRPRRARSSARRAASACRARPATLRTAEAEAAIARPPRRCRGVVAYGLILPKPILDAFPLGAFNLHASLLPRWRGAAPINRAIMAGDAETGVMVMKMEEGLDTGPIAMAERVPIGPDDGRRPARPARPPRRRPDGAGARRARARLAHAHAAADAGVTYAHKIDKDETRIDWARPWREVHDHIRGLSPFPGAWFEMRARARSRQGAAHHQGEGAGAPGTVLDDQLTVACGDGAVRILELQRAGRQAMKAGRIPARLRRCRRHAFGLGSADAALQADHRI